MDIITTGIIALVAGLALGFLISRMAEKGKASRTVEAAKKEAAAILKDAKAEGENLKKEKIYQAKEKFLELKAEHEKVIMGKDKKIAEAEKRIRDKESQVSSELARNKKLTEQLDVQVQELEKRREFYERKQGELEKLHLSQIQQLEVISGLSAEEAKGQLLESLKESARADAMAFLQTSLEEAKMTAQQEAKKIIVNTIQRIGTEEAVIAIGGLGGAGDGGRQPQGEGGQ